MTRVAYIQPIATGGRVPERESIVSAAAWGAVGWQVSANLNRLFHNALNTPSPLRACPDRRSGGGLGRGIDCGFLIIDSRFLIYFDEQLQKMTRVAHIQPIATGAKPPEVVHVLHSQILQRSVFGVQCSVFIPLQRSVFGVQCSVFIPLQRSVFGVQCSVFSSPYLAGIEEQLTQNDPETNRFFYHPDHLGSSSFITDANGEGYQHLQYLPFGETAVSQKLSWWSTPYQFTGKEKDDETGYNYFGARYYNSDVSVWLSVDPMSDERSWLSPYNYCQLNPANRTDPTGTIDWKPVTNCQGKLFYQAEANDSFYTFLDEFNVSREDAIQIFIENGLQPYIPFEIIDQNGLKKESWLLVPLKNAGNNPQKKSMIDFDTTIETNQPLQMNWDNNTDDKLVNQWAMTQKWLTVNRKTTIDWRNVYSFPPNATHESIINQSVKINGVVSAITLYFNLTTKTTTFAYPQFEGSPTGTNYESWNYYMPESAGRFANPVLQTNVPKSLANFLW